MSVCVCVGRDVYIWRERGREREGTGRVLDGKARITTTGTTTITTHVSEKIAMMVSKKVAKNDDAEITFLPVPARRFIFSHSLFPYTFCSIKFAGRRRGESSLFLLLLRRKVDASEHTFMSYGGKTSNLICGLYVLRASDSSFFSFASSSSSSFLLSIFM